MFSIKQILIPFSSILISVIVGLSVEKYIDSYINHLISESEPDTSISNQEENSGLPESLNDTDGLNILPEKLTIKAVLLHSFNNVTLFWFLLAGFFTALTTSPLPPNISNPLSQILVIAFLSSVTIFIARLSSGFVTLFGQKTQIISASIISNLTRAIVFIFGLLIILQTIGVKITPILTTLGVGGLAIALAVQDTLSNLFAGLYLILSQQFKTGDYVKLETGQEGYVIDINWRTTTIKDNSNYVIIIPNSKLATVIFTNCHLPVKEAVLQVDLGVSYASNLESVEQVTIEVAKQVIAEIAPDLITHEPFIRYHTFAESSINFTVFLRVNEFIDRRLAQHIFIKKLHQRYQQEKIEIPNPCRDILIKSITSI